MNTLDAKATQVEASTNDVTVAKTATSKAKSASSESATTKDETTAAEEVTSEETAGVLLVNASKLISAAYRELVGQAEDAPKVHANPINSEGKGVWIISGKSAAVNSIMKKLMDASSIAEALQKPEGVMIHSTQLNASKETANQTRKLTITHVITTY